MQEISGHLARPGGGRLAWRRVEGARPTVVWLGGFRSEMAGTKAEALAQWAAAARRDFLRFDYQGHGRSSGAFQDGTISLWREDALAVIDALTEGPATLVGSSMGGWLACLAALARPERVGALVLIAPAADFTEALMKPAFPPQAHEALARDGVWTAPDEFGDGGYPITRALIEDGARWSILPGPLPIAGKVRILQGARDRSVPWTHAQQLVAAIDSPDIVFTLIKDGDHRLSRPQDLARIIAAAAEG